MLEEAAKIARKVRTPTELDRFEAYVRDGAIITDVSAHSVTAEGGESTRTTSQGRESPRRSTTASTPMIYCSRPRSRSPGA